MKWLRRYNESTTIKATDGTIKEIISDEINKLGWDSDLNHIDVSKVARLKNLFFYSDFNGDISNWNVGNVKDMHSMFGYSKFNGNISSWNVSKVKYMSGMFNYSQFNGDISQWNVENVIDMSYMFSNSQFNRDISRWNVGNVKNISHMFAWSIFSGDLSYWDLKKITKKDYFLYSSSMKDTKPWWWVIGSKFRSYKLMYESIEEWKWIDLDKKIIWDKRLKKALKDSGVIRYSPTTKIYGFIII